MSCSSWNLLNPGWRGFHFLLVVVGKMNYHDPKEMDEAYEMLCCMVWVKEKKVWNELSNIDGWWEEWHGGKDRTWCCTCMKMSNHSLIQSAYEDICMVGNVWNVVVVRRQKCKLLRAVYYFFPFFRHVEMENAVLSAARVIDMMIGWMMDDG